MLLMETVPFIRAATIQPKDVDLRISGTGKKANVTLCDCKQSQLLLLRNYAEKIGNLTFFQMRISFDFLFSLCSSLKVNKQN